jgi:hypothetical protein
MDSPEFQKPSTMDSIVTNQPSSPNEWLWEWGEWGGAGLRNSIGALMVDMSNPYDRMIS